jgi:hypothetical protein
LKPQHLEEDAEDSVQAFMENGILVERKYLPDPDAIEPEVLVPRWQPKNMG